MRTPYELTGLSCSLAGNCASIHHNQVGLLRFGDDLKAMSLKTIRPLLQFGFIQSAAQRL